MAEAERLYCVQTTIQTGGGGLRLRVPLERAREMIRSGDADAMEPVPMTDDPPVEPEVVAPPPPEPEPVPESDLLIEES